MRNILNISSAILAALLLSFSALAQGRNGGKTFGSVEFDRLIYDFKTYRLTAQDKIIIYVTPTDIRRIEKIFYL